MATKKQPVKRSSSAKTVPAKKTGRRISAKALYTERNPDKNKVTGKFKFFYLFFVGTTLLFAALAVVFFIMACDLEAKYESIDACTRAHTSCTVKSDGSVSSSEEPIVEDNKVEGEN